MVCYNNMLLYTNFYDIVKTEINKLYDCMAFFFFRTQIWQGWELFKPVINGINVMEGWRARRGQTDDRHPDGESDT